MIRYLMLLAMALAISATARAAWRESEVTIDGGTAPLHGSLIVPEGDGFDAVLIISGSGPTDRDGNQPGLKNDSLKMVADGLGDAGIASIRVDKRGIAASAAAMMREEDLRFETYIDDGKAWLALLRAQKGVRRVFVIGHSEGALIATVLAESQDVAGLVTLSGAGMKAADILRRQFREAPNGAAILALAEPTLAKLEAGQLDPSPNPLLGALFRPGVQPYLISWFKYDPAAEIGKVPGRVLIIQGNHDLQITPADAQRLNAGHPGATLVTVDGMNHVLKPAPLDRKANIAAYSDPSLPLAPSLMPAIFGFIK